MLQRNGGRRPKKRDRVRLGLGEKEEPSEEGPERAVGRQEVSEGGEGV